MLFCAFAADVAVLRNGFSIRHERREVWEIIGVHRTRQLSYVTSRRQRIEREKDLNRRRG